MSRRNHRCPGDFSRTLLALLLAMACPAYALGANVIERVAVTTGDREIVVSISSSAPEPLKVESFSLDDPPRLVFDLTGASLAPGQPSAFPVTAPNVCQVRVGQHQADPPIVRIVVDISENVELPQWQLVPGEDTGETLIILATGGAINLRPPSVQTFKEGLLLRFSGVGRLPRRVGTLQDPPRVFVDLTDAQLETGYTEGFADGMVREIRMAQQPAAEGRPVARFVVEMAEPLSHCVFPDGADLVTAVGREPWGLPLTEYRGSGQLRGKRIVVDAGHGGKDTGAPAVFGCPRQVIYEKDVVLDIGQRLARLLRAEGAEVTMTRSDDTYVSLRERAALANRLKAEAFVSIHCNSCAEPNALRGTSVYYDHAHSVRLARVVQEEMVAALGTQDKGVRNANFAVIRRTQMPGILVETAFINHEGDRMRLMNTHFRERAARAILQGMIRFFSESVDAGAPGA